VYLWCNRCFLAWTESSGRIGDRKTELQADHDLARQVVLDMTSGVLDIPQEILDLDAYDVPDKVFRLPSTGPSAN